MNLEGRFIPNLEIISLLFGAAIFADVGRAWEDGERFRLSGLDRSIGVGLRISFEKSTKTELVRADLAYGHRNAWELSVSSGQYF